MSIRMVLILVAVCLGYSGATAQEHSHPTPRQLMIPASLFEKAVDCIKGFEGWHSARHQPYYQKYNVIQSNIDYEHVYHCTPIYL